MAVAERVQTRTGPSSSSWRRGLAIGVALIAVSALVMLSARGAFSQLGPPILILTPGVLLALLPFAVWSYGLRVARWHVLLRTLSPTMPLKVSLHTQVVGFTFATTPGRIGELYKLRMLERASGLPAARSLPAVAIERLTDLAAFGSLAVAGGWLSWTGSTGTSQVGHWAALGLALVALAICYQVGSRRWPGWRSGRLACVVHDRVARLSRRLPGSGRLLGLLNQFQAGATQVTNPRVLVVSLACVVLGRLGDAMVIHEVARIVGYPVSFPTAMLLIAAAGLAGGLSLSPGGIGSAEAALVALTLAEGIPVEAALTIALLSRALIFWGWVILGLVVFAAGVLLEAVVGSNRDAHSSPLPTRN